MGSLLLFACRAPVEDQIPADAEAALASCDVSEERAAVATASAEFEVPVCLHAVWPSEGAAERRFDDELAEGTENRHIDRVNRLLRGAPNGEDDERTLDTGIQLVLASLEVHADKELVELGDVADHQVALETLGATWNRSGCVNVYVLFNDDAVWDGAFASYPGRPELGGIVTVNQPDERRLAHEWGHVLGLRHTHEEGYGAEWEGNCDVTGDLRCDTPADPGPERCRQWNDSDAEVSWVECPERFASIEDEVPLDNLMSYWEPPWTSQGFSSEQIERMHCTWRQGQELIVP